MMAETLIIEIIDDQTGLETDQTGSILVTDLLNYAMPMIRYRIGDAASFLKGQCDCGRQLPRLQSIDGRVTDFLVGDSGQFVSGVFLATYVVAFRPSLGQVQMVQDDPGQVLFKVKPGEDFDRDQDFAYLVETAKQHLGQSAVVDIEIVDEIAKTPTGKMQFSISRATPTFARAGDQSG